MMTTGFLGDFFRQAMAARTRQQDMLMPPLMPDEETLRRTRRRTFARKRRTGRSSTILSDPDRLG